MSVVITAGPIPSKLDSVKYITNRFRGSLMLKLAEALFSLGHSITLVKWKYSDIKSSLISNIIEVDDVIDYYSKVLDIQANGYILGAAVANLMPSNLYSGKFPSHNYKVGDQFDIKFEIAPRLIDDIKKKYPRSTLIGYKLFDGDHEELIAAGRKVLYESKANAIFCNTPGEAKHSKYMLTQDGANIKVNFNEHISYTDRLLKAKYYKTKIIDEDIDIPTKIKVLSNVYPKSYIDGKTYGCFAAKHNGGFITTPRGHKGNLVYVKEVDHINKIIYATGKATLNAPTMDILLDNDTNVVLHNHEIKKGIDVDYLFPGTDEEVDQAKTWDPVKLVNIKGHGYIARFKNIKESLSWIGIDI